MGNTETSMMDTVIQLKMTERQLTRMSTKSQADSEKNKRLVKKHLEKGDQETARIYAENAIRKKNEATNYLRMAGRINAVQSRLKSAETMKMVSQQMGSVVHGMDKAMKSMDLEQMALVMDKFEASFAELDVRAGVLESGMQAGVSSTMPEHQIDALLGEVAEEHNLEVDAALADPSAALPQQAQESVGQLSTDQEAQLAHRLAQLRS
eukprot:m.357664 g.357664  ORF g.357664 m.357664 type:complete len:208 (-) comp17894_c0_seq1:464-1087(-)